MLVLRALQIGERPCNSEWPVTEEIRSKIIESVDLPNFPVVFLIDRDSVHLRKLENSSEILGTSLKMCLICTWPPVKSCWKIGQSWLFQSNLLRPWREASRRARPFFPISQNQSLVGVDCCNLQSQNTQLNTRGLHYVPTKVQHEIVRTLGHLWDLFFQSPGASLALE